MTEKRFTVDDGLEDVLCWEINDKENENMTCGECAKLLNDLTEKNTTLKERRHEDINELAVIAIKYKAMQDENGQLKQQLELYQELYPTGKWICDLNSDELKKELIGNE